RQFPTLIRRRYVSPCPRRLHGAPMMATTPSASAHHRNAQPSVQTPRHERSGRRRGRTCRLRMAMPTLACELPGEVGPGSQTALLLWPDPAQELPRRNGAKSANGAAEVTRDVRVEQPVPEESDEITRQQHDGEGDQQSLP